MSSKLRIGIHTWGSEGDIRPFIFLAEYLSSLGHDISFVYSSIDNRDYGNLINDSKIKVIRAGKSYFSSFNGLTLKDLKGGQLMQIDNILEALLDPVIDDIFEASYNICREQDINIVHFLNHPAITAIEKSGKKAIPLITAPVIPSRNYTSLGINCGFFNKLMWNIAGPWIDHILIKKRIDPFRIKKGLSPVKTFFTNFINSFPITFTIVSPSLFPKPDDWGEQHYISGFIDNHSYQSSWQLPDELNKFLNAGDPAIFITLGSMLSYNTKDTEDSIVLLADASRISGLRTVFQVSHSLLGKIPGYKNIFPLYYAPHSSIFPRCSAVVHHGGAGTTHTVLKYGCPSIVIPHLIDQFFWGSWLYKRGLSPAPINRKNLTANKLAKKIIKAVESPHMKANAVKISKAMANENGLLYIADYLINNIPSCK